MASVRGSAAAPQLDYIRGGTCEERTGKHTARESAHNRKKATLLEARFALLCLVRAKKPPEKTGGTILNRGSYFVEDDEVAL